MGAAQSTDTVGNDSGEVLYGFQVLRVDSNSPAEVAKLSPFFDYIVSVNGVIVIQETPNAVAEMARNHVGRPMKMVVYNSRSDSIRETTIIPNNNWGGKTLLGASIRFAQYSGSADRVWHILSVHPSSPASNAGLIANKDWIIGSPAMVLNSQDDFYNLMIHNTGKPVKLLVFNSDTNSVREAQVVSSFDWGGEGCLGCDIGSGMLHRIPQENMDSKSHVYAQPPSIEVAEFVNQTLS